MKAIKITLACMMIFSAVFILSCKKNDSSTPVTADTEVASSGDNALAENVSNDIESIGAQVTDGSNLNNAREMAPQDLSMGCVGNINIVNHVITVSFNGDTCYDGRTRSGELIFDFSGTMPPAIHYRDPGFKLIVTSNNYRINGKLITVYKSVTNVTDTTFNNYGFHFDSAHVNEMWHITANITITTDAGTVTWNCDRMKELLNTGDTTVYHGDGAGSRHITWNKARIGITGTANGTTAQGTQFTAETQTQLVRDFQACNPWAPFIRGVLDFKPGAKLTRHIDFGYMKNPPDSCDNWISVAIGSNTYYHRIW